MSGGGLPRSIVVGGHRWRIVWADRLAEGDTCGECESPDMPRKRIRIRRDLDGEDLARVVIHEIVHAGCYALDEPTTDAIAVAAARLLTRLGFKR